MIQKNLWHFLLLNFEIRQSHVKIQGKPTLKQSKRWFCPATDSQLPGSWSPGHRPGKSVTSENQTPLHTTHSGHSEPEIRFIGLILCLLMRFTLKIWVDQKIQEAWLLSSQALSLWKENHFLLGSGFIQYPALRKERSSLFGCQNIKPFRILMSWNIAHVTVTKTKKRRFFCV